MLFARVCLIILDLRHCWVSWSCQSQKDGRFQCVRMRASVSLIAGCPRIGYNISKAELPHNIPIVGVTHASRSWLTQCEESGGKISFWNLGYPFQIH